MPRAPAKRNDPLAFKGIKEFRLRVDPSPGIQRFEFQWIARTLFFRREESAGWSACSPQFVDALRSSLEKK